MNDFNQTIRRHLSFLDNEYASAVISLFLVLYAGLAAPKLPRSVARLFDNQLFKILIFFLIAYTSKKDPTIAIIAAVGLMISLQTLSKYNVEKKMIDIVRDKNMRVNVPQRQVVQQRQVVPRPIQVAQQPTQVIPEIAQTESGITNESLEELRQDADVESVDFRDKFYPGYVDYARQHNEREPKQEVNGMQANDNYASV